MVEGLVVEGLAVEGLAVEGFAVEGCRHQRSDQVGKGPPKRSASQGLFVHCPDMPSQT